MGEFVCTHMCVPCVDRVPMKTRRGIRSPGIGVMDECEAAGGYLRLLSHLSSSKIRVLDKAAKDRCGLFLFSILCVVHLKNCLFTPSQRIQTANLLDGASNEMTRVVRGHSSRTCLKYTRRNGKMWFSTEILLQNVHLRTFWTFLCSVLTLLERILRISCTFWE